jgi:hypothetical protein
VEGLRSVDGVGAGFAGVGGIAGGGGSNRRNDDPQKEDIKAWN